MEVYWECEIHKMMKKDERLKKIYDEYNMDDSGPIDIRSAFLGGRTGPMKLYHEVAPDEKISYYDITSLYPFINLSTEYPIDHPTSHILYKDVDWRRPEENPYRLALIKAFIVPPKHCGTGSTAEDGAKATISDMLYMLPTISRGSGQ